MNLEQLHLPKGPWLHVLVGHESAACDLAWDFAKSARHAVARVIRGQKARTTNDLFDEVAAALQFPCYFGENWNAFDECLADLEWLPANAYAIFITNSMQLLDKENVDEQHRFFNILARQSREWSMPAVGEHPRPAKAFHIVLQCAKEDEAALTQKLQASKVAFDFLK